MIFVPLGLYACAEAPLEFTVFVTRSGRIPASNLSRFAEMFHESHLALEMSQRIYVQEKETSTRQFPFTQSSTGIS